MRLPFSCLLLFGCLLLAIGTRAQTTEQKIDSLVKELSNMPLDTNKVWTLYHLSYKHFQINPEKGVEYGKQALTLSRKLTYKKGEAYANKAIARCYAIQNQFPEALKYFQTALTQARRLNDYNLEAAVLVSLGSVYTNKGEYDKALKYLVEAKEPYKRSGVAASAHLMNNIGRVYLKKEDTSKALSYFLEGIAIEEQKAKLSSLLVILYANVGSIYTISHEYPKGFNYLFKALRIQQDKGNAKGAANTLNSIGRTYQHAVICPDGYHPDSLKDKSTNLKKAVFYLKKAEDLSLQLHRNNTLMLVYENLSDSYKELGDYQQALNYHSLFAATKDSLRDLDEEKRFAKVEAEFLVKKKTDSLKYLNALKDEEIATGKTIRNGSILMLGLLAVVGILFFNRQNIKRKKLQAEKQLADNQLASATHRLNIFTSSLKEKNELIENFTEEIERLQSLPCSNELPDTKENLTKLQNSIILTEEQWDDFKELFEQVHVGFLGRLKEKMPNLTPAEIRFLALSKLNLSNKEMAGMLGIGLSGMRNYKYRLRKKLDLSDDEHFDRLIEEI